MRSLNPCTPLTPSRSLCLFLLLLVGAGPASRASAQPAPASARFADNGAALENPAMGWVFHHYDNSIDKYGSRLPATYAGEDFPGATVVYLRLAWSFLEPREGVFDWSVVDSVAQRWIARGKKVAFRFTCCESGLRYATPEWVRLAGAKGVDWVWNRTQRTGPLDPAKALWSPTFDDPIFLAKLEPFLAAAAARYDGDPNVAFIDIGTYGLWGEGHTFATGQPPSREAVRKHIDLFHKYFKKTLIVGQDDWPEDPEAADFTKAGTFNSDLLLGLPGPEAGGAPFEVKVGLWVPNSRERPNGRFLPGHGDPDRRVTLGTLTASATGRIVFTPAATPSAPAPGADYDVRIAGGIKQTGRRWTLPLAWTIERPLPGAKAFWHLERGGQIIYNGDFRPAAVPSVIRFAQSLGMSLRDDSILVQGGARAYFHENFAQIFWPTVPVVIESEHYGPSRDKGFWGDGSAYLAALEDYHASYCSIHWFPQEFYQANQDLIRRMNLRMGYRIQLRQAAWPVVVDEDKHFSVIDFSATWRNGGVAPCYPGGFPALTLKDAQGGLAAVAVDEAFDVRQLPVGPPELAATVAEKARLPLPPNLKPGGYDLYLSVGERSGKPVLALPLEGGDDQRRYKIGRITVGAANTGKI